MSLRTQTLRNGDPVSELRLAGTTSKGGKSRSNARFANDAGDINAGSKKELIEKFAELLGAVNSGEITRTADTAESMDSQRRNAEALLEAYNDGLMSPKMKVIGDTIVEELVEVGKREGFTDLIFGKQPVSQGQDGKVRIRYKQAVAVIATSATEVAAVKYRERYIRPPTYNLSANLLIDDAELRLSPVGILEEMFEDGMEACSVRQDRLSKQFLDQMNGIMNTPVSIPGNLTPEIWSILRESIEAFGNPASTALLAYDFIKDISGGTSFSNFLDPVSKYQVVLEGRLGSMMGVNIVTDAYREPKLKVLDVGELYVVSAPKNLGVVVEHQPLTPYQVDQRNIGQASQGWFINGVFAQVAQNPRASIKATRI